MSSRITGAMDPARRWSTINPSGAVLNPRPKALWANVAGNLTVEGHDGNAETFAVGAGSVDLSPTKVTAWSGAVGTLKGLFD